MVGLFFLATRLGDPDPNSRSRLNLGGELRVSEARTRGDQARDYENTRFHHSSFFGGEGSSFSARSLSMKRCDSPIRSTLRARVSTDC